MKPASDATVVEDETHASGCEQEPGTNKPPGGFGRDLMASGVVFLVALPLCMGIAIASGVPPALGLATGMIGGLVVGFFSGQPLQVSGPAAGLAVMVWQLVTDFGLNALGPAVLVAGMIQLIAGVAGLGRWFRAVSPPVVQGMLAGIGVLIAASQFHVMVDDKPRGSGVENLLSIPSAIQKGMLPVDGGVHHLAAAVGLITIVSLVAWNRLRPRSLRMIPGPLIGVLAGSTAAGLFGLQITHVEVPTDLASSLNWIQMDSLSMLTTAAFWPTAIGLAVIASAETLLCATAVDRMHDGPRTLYNKELRSQGIGNMLCGLIGALPMTGVIVRSSANVEAGAKTKWSAILHGAWILILVVLLPQLLAQIPTSSLAAILVYTGWKLLGIDGARQLARKGRSEFMIWAVTVITIVLTDLLVGVATGLALALGRLLLTFARLEVEVQREGERVDINLRGAATFMSLPKLAEALESIPNGSAVHFHLDRVAYVDHACLELIEDWHERHPGSVFLELESLQKRNNPSSLYAA